MKHIATTVPILLCIAAGTLVIAAETPPQPVAMLQTHVQPIDPALIRIVADPARNPKNVARDQTRHPAAELTFFGLKPNMTVVEVWPGNGYWTEILAPYLKARGHYIAAVTTTGLSPEQDGMLAAWKKSVQEQQDRYGLVTFTGLGKGQYEVAPAGSADLIVTFRNLHNWMDGGYVDEVFKGMYAALKPGGLLGIEDHRAKNDDKPQDPKATSGYVREDYTIELARKAGFEFVGASEINANLKDTKDYPKGVWTLPPTLILEDQDRARYLAIGEADNFVLKFRKPAA